MAPTPLLAQSQPGSPENASNKPGEGGENAETPDADGDGTSDAAEAEAAEADRAEVADAASITGVEVNVGTVDTTENPNAQAGSVTIDGVAMTKEAAMEAISAIADARDNHGLNAQPNWSNVPGARNNPGVNIQATLEAHASGKTGIVGNLSGEIGTPEAVARAESTAASGGSAASSLGSIGSGPKVADSITALETNSAILAAYNQFATGARQAGLLSLGGTARVTNQGTVINQNALDAYRQYAEIRSQAEVAAVPETEYEVTPGNNLTVEARLAAAGFNPDGSLQRAVTIDYEALLGVTAGRVQDYLSGSKLDSKIAMEQNLIAMALNSNLDQVTLGQVNAQNIDKYGSINNRDTNGAFAKSLDNDIAPGIWSNSNRDGREQLGMSYIANITGFTPNQAAGMIGNFRAESGLDHLEEAAGSERSSGLAQWNAARGAGERRQALEEYAGIQFSSQLANGRHTSGPGAFTQLSFAVAEMNGRLPSGHKDHGAERVGREFKSNPDMTVEQAARMFQNEFERPADRAHSLGHRQSSAREALAEYYSINPNQNNFAANINPAPVSPQTDESGRRTGGASPQLSIEVGGMQISIDTGKFAELLGGLFSGADNGSSYTTLPSSENNDRGDVQVQGVIVNPDRPTVCTEGKGGFSFSIKLSSHDQANTGYSCDGDTTADYFTVIAGYIKGLGIDSLSESDAIKKMGVTIR